MPWTWTPAPAPQLHPQHLRFLADFLDVPCSDIFHHAVEILRRQDLATGCGGGNYCPATGALRGQTAAFLVKPFAIPFTW